MLVEVIYLSIHHMVMIRINIAEEKAHFSRYIESVERGETVTVCRRNVPVAEIRALPQPGERGVSQRLVCLGDRHQVPARPVAVT